MRGLEKVIPHRAKSGQSPPPRRADRLKPWSDGVSGRVAPSQVGDPSSGGLPSAMEGPT